MASRQRRFRKPVTGASRVAPAAVGSPMRLSRYRWWLAPLVLVALGALLPGALVAVPEMPEGPLFPLRKVEVTGDLQRLDPQQLRSRLLPEAVVGFFDVDVRQLRERVSDMSWVGRVQITRQWPDELIITITEREPAARWRSQGLLDTEGQLFLVDTLLDYSALPLLSGPDGSEQKVYAGYQFLRNALMQLPQPINEVALDSRGVWRLRTVDGVMITFRGEPDNVPLERLIRVYRQQLLPHWDKVRSVDLRYSDGFAVAFAENSVVVEEGGLE
ncbi:MAG: FtsQ-type POTRA domain-containing protein [Gammaproteobacteria bacterium]